MLQDETGQRQRQRQRTPTGFPMAGSGVTNNPAGVSIPSVAEGVPVGAMDGYSAKDCVSGTLHNVKDFGARMDGSTDDSGAIMEALRKSASSGGAAYLPAGQYSGEIRIDSSMNGGTLVGDGYGTEITGSGDIIYLGDSAAYEDIKIVNLRLTGGGGSGIDTTNGGNDQRNSILIENIWADNNQSTGIRCDYSGTVIRHCSTWSNSEFQGVAGWNVPPNDRPRNRMERCLAWDNGGVGIDPSEGSWIVDGCMSIGNTEGGAKIGPEDRYGSQNPQTTVRNTVLMDNPDHGFRNTGDRYEGPIKIDNVLSMNNQEGGIVIRNGFTCEIGNNAPVYVIDNGKHGLWAYDGGEFTGGTVYSCGNNDNTNGPVNVSDLNTSVCDAPSPTEIITGSAGSG